MKTSTRSSPFANGPDSQSDDISANVLTVYRFLPSFTCARLIPELFTRTLQWAWMGIRPGVNGRRELFSVKFSSHLRTASGFRRFQDGDPE
jgi:hypothetical protein